MKKCCYILFFFLHSSLCISQSGIRVNIVNIPKKIAPGSYFNLIFDVESSSTFKEKMTVSLKVPDTWEVLSKKEPEVIIGQKKVKYIFSVNTSEFTPPGAITSRILINTVSGYRIEKPFQVQVLPVRKIIISPVLLPESAKEGDSLRVEYLVENRGNIKDNLKLEALGGKIDGKSEVNGINPNESTKIFTKLLIPEGETNSFNYTFGIKAILKDSLKPITFTNSILVYSKKIKKTELYNRFPINVGFWSTMYFVNKKATYGVQADISGNGYLDKANRHLLNFIIHGPTNFNIPFLGSYDIYTLRYKYSKNKFMSSVQFGDFTLQLNQLMENGRFGRGANFETRYNKIGIYAFYIQPRFFNEQRTTFGGSLYFIPNPKLRLSIDYSSKYTQISRFVWVNLVGLAANYKTERFNFESELTGSMYSKKYDFAALAKIGFNIRKLNYGGNFIYSGKEFYGYFRNSYLLSNSISVNVSKKVSLGVNANIMRLNPSMDVINFSTSPFSTNIMGYAGYNINQNSSINLSYNWQKNEDRMEPKRFFYQQEYARLAYNLNGTKINVWYEGRFGKAKNLLALDDPSIIRQNISNVIQPEVRILPWAWAGVYLQHDRTSRFSAQNILTDYFYYGASLRLPINNKLNAYFNYRSNYALDELTQTQSLLYTTVNLNLKKHTFQLLGGKTLIPSFNSSMQNTLYFVLKYSYLLNAPISRVKNLGNIQGQISLTSAGLKKEGIVITLGDRKYVSDKDGRFYFKNLISDKYYIDIDRTSVPQGVIANLRLPLEVDLKGDSTKQINLSLTKTGSIVGKVFFVNVDNDERKAKPSVLIKVSNDEETFFTKVNKDDEFSCKQVKPGKWLITASVIGGNQEDYSITDATQSIEVVEDNRIEVDFTIENYKRTVEFSPTTFNLIDKRDNKKEISASNSSYKKFNRPNLAVSKSKPKVKNVKQTKKTTRNQKSKKKTTYRLIKN